MLPAASRTCSRCWPRARRAASTCRSSNARSPATRRPPAIVRALPRFRPFRPIGPTAPSGKLICNIGAVMSLTLAQASTIVDVALKKGRDSNLAPLTVAVLDAGGHLVAFKREDKSGLLRFDIAYGKAWGALGMGFGSRELAERAGKNPLFIGALTTIAQGRLVPVPGGVLIKDAGGAVLGAVGISGDVSDKDEACAIAGIEAAG